ncbi:MULTISPECIES: YunC family protein [unclassified Sporolactobacillus]|uniref:YunC family protein n=1 Tax=unclassified Sporolactobacillus TaxID=2628533 RepID=UPI0023685911|nr:DUF1805 domain-containing protein [Sporolactobacillus sp. CQH2019]MDD9147396.1 DUF1805 domain-containing protein [Sporolactobacillus sp. CQH2019]
MIELEPVMIDGLPFQGITVKLPKTTLLAVAGQSGYIMCGALDVRLLNDQLADRGIIAGKAVGVRTLAELLNAPLAEVTAEAENRGVKAGMPGREALLKMG